MAFTVVLRPWRPSDREALAALANDRRVSINLRDLFPYPYGVEDADRFITLVQGLVPQTSFAIQASGQLAGGIGYTLHTDVERVAAEVGYWIGVPFWGHGIATEAVRLVTAMAFSRHPDLRRLEIGLGEIADGMNGQGGYPRCGLVTGKEDHGIYLHQELLRDEGIDVVREEMRLLDRYQEIFVPGKARTAMQLSDLGPSAQIQQRIAYVNAGNVRY